MTVLESIQRSTDFLAKKGVDSPRLQVESLLAHLLKLKRMALYLNFERVLTESETNELRELIRRRSLREPLQHIVGTTSFCGIELAVNRNVLAPRPETELLAELAWQELNGACGTQNAELNDRPVGEGSGRKLRALDFGTGSGCLAIALATKCPDAEIVAVDISPDALKIARENAAKNSVESHIQFIEGDGFKALPADARFDLIVSNPPYIASDEIATLEPEVRDFDPRLALDGGRDGLDFYRRLAGEAGGFLRSCGYIMMELGDGQADAVRTLFSENEMWIVEAVKDDYSRRPRILVAQKAH